MGADPVRGRTIRWTYEDGPMAGKSFEHVFGEDGNVTWRETSGDDRRAKPPSNGKQKTGKPATEARAKYEVAPVNDDVYAVSYLAEVRLHSDEHSRFRIRDRCELRIERKRARTPTRNVRGGRARLGRTWS